MGKHQLNWLSQTLQQSRINKEKVFIVSHQPILPGSTSSVGLMWNYEQVLDIIRHYNDVIIACFAGHAHKGGYKRDDEYSGIHFHVLEAVLETNAPLHTFCVMEVFEEKVVLQGFGDCTSACYEFDHILKKQVQL